MFAMAGVPFSNDAEYALAGIVGGVVGVTLAPVVAAYPQAILPSLRYAIRVAGFAACLALLATGVLLVLGASGSLGERAPGWITSAFGLALVSLFVWILTANVFMTRNARLDGAVRWLVILAGASFLLIVAISSIISFTFAAKSSSL